MIPTTLKDGVIFAFAIAVGLAVALVIRASTGAEHEHGSKAMHGMPTSRPTTRPATRPATAASAADATAEPVMSSEIVIDLQNDSCPIGHKAPLDSEFVVWSGLRVGFCCPGCDSTFLEDPPKHLAAAGIEYQEALAAIRAYGSAPEEDRPALLEQIQEKFTVVKP